jgi:DNA-binding MarR family transcriptional regulator
MPSMFARRRACAPAAVSRTLRQLLDRDLVRASIGALDGRQRVYRLTANGRRTLARLHEKRARAIETIWESYSPEQLRAFSRFASDLAERLETYLGSP